jgi:biofilm PGA synthesis N-glycosyltransferase PgaC
MSDESQVSDIERFGNVRYVVITPVRNEAEFIEKTIHSMVQQTVRATEWVIVNDGSTDETAEIVARYTADHPWIRLVNREDRGARQRGKGVVEAFYTGYEALTCQDYDYIVKLDGDLSFQSTYFLSLWREFASNPKLGIAGGGIWEKPDGENWVLHTARDHVRGATKVYRQTCFEAIGGLIPAMGWDGMDEWKALARGWEVQSLLKLKALHYRYTGTATGSVKSRIEEGYAAHHMGYHPLFLIVRGLRHFFDRPYLVGGAAMIIGYFAAWLRGQERLQDPDVIRYMRHIQLRQLAGLLVGKPIHR